MEIVIEIEKPNKSVKKEPKQRKATTGKRATRSKKKVEEILNSKYPNSNLQKDFDLTYDFDIDEQYKTYIGKYDGVVNLDRINKLPCLKLKKSLIIDETKYQDDPEEEINEVVNNIDQDIEIDTLEKEKIGDKYYYFDYNKGIIYNILYKPIGHIDEYGDISIDECE